MTSLPTDRPLTVADMLRLADVCERDGYVSNLGTNIRRAFTPAPAPDAALPGGCVLGMGTARSDDEHGYLVHSASGKWWWDIEGKKWKKLKAREWAGIYARAEALANPPSAPPPDYTPAPSKPESVDAERPTTETLDWRDEIYQTALRVLQSAPPLPPATPASKPESPAPSPVEGEPVCPYPRNEYARCVDVWKESAEAWRTHTASLRSSLAAARTEVEAYKRAKSENDERFMIERDEARAEAAALKVRVERAEALVRAMARCPFGAGCPTCQLAAASLSSPTGEKGAGK